MNKKFSVKSPFQMVTLVTVIFMFLNAFLPINFFFLQAEVTEYPFKLITTLEKSTYSLSEPVNVTWTLINIGDENITLYHSCDTFDFIVYDENFNYVFQYGTYHAILHIVLPFAPIPPGMTINLTASWKQIYYGSENVPQREQVPPGTYYIVGTFLSSTYKSYLETSAIKITIIG